MYCRSYLIGFLISAAVLASACTPNQQARPTRPNIVFIMSDDHAVRTISAFDSTIASTPNIDRIAAGGVVFGRAFVGNSICGPSRATILTGKHSHLHGVMGNGDPWDSTQAVFPRILKQNGYQTALFGKWHLNSLPSDEFDRYRILTGAGKQGFYYNPEFLDSVTGPEDVSGYSTDLVTDDALRWLADERNPAEPFLLLVQYKAPHVPRMPPLRHLTRYEGETISEPSTLHDDLDTRTYYAKQVNFFLDRYNPLPPYGTYDPSRRNIYLARMTEEELRQYHAAIDPENAQFREMLESGSLTDSTAMRSYVYQRFIKDYLRIVDALDENVGRIIDHIEGDARLNENTVVVYASDQGYFTGEHGYAEKRLMYEEAMRMPLLMRGAAGAAPGRRVNALVQNIDLAPTFLDIAGIDKPDDMQGRSLLPLLRGDETDDWRDAVYYQYFDHGRHVVGRHAGVRTERYKLVHFYTDDTWEFYDLAEDPMELRNGYSLPENRVVVERMKERYYDLRQRYSVPDSLFVAPFGR